MSIDLVRLRQIEKSYRLGKVVVPALNNVDLDIGQGEFLVIHGPSGSGKTTLLNILGCLDKPDSGSYFLRNRELTAVDLGALAPTRNLDIGFIFQSFNLIPVLNVVENIEFPCIIRQKPEPRKLLRERACRLAEEVGLSHVLRHRPDELSGGQRQRVAIARALITGPALVLADEPTANLDSETSMQILKLMLQLNRENGVTFIFSTHDAQVMSLARRTVHLRDGHIQS